MTPTAVLYDIHGNMPALEAVIEDARTAGAERFVLGGDYALMGAYPREVVGLLGTLGATWIRGNADRWASGDDHDMPAAPAAARPYCRQQLGSATITRLNALDTHTTIDGTLFCHASPHSDMEPFWPDPADTEGQLLEGVDEQIVVFGHTHLQFSRESGNHLLVNPGSVGLPWDGDRRAAYALWAGGREFDLRRVEYDSAVYVAAVREEMGATLGEHLETLVRRIEDAKFDV